MKKLLIVLMLALLPSLAVADWDYFGTSTNPLIQAYYTTLYANTIQPLIQGTGQVGTAENPFNSACSDTFKTNPNFGGINAWAMILSSTTGAGAGLVGSDSLAGQTRGSGYFNYSKNYLGWITASTINSTDYISGNGLRSSSYIQMLSNVADVSKNNIIYIKATVDNPYIAFRDSSAGAAPTRDSTWYNGASFVYSKPLVMTVYASGTEPTTAELGQVITIDGTTTSDSLLVYLGGAWRVLYP